MVDLAAPKTFILIEHILERKSFTQYSAAKELKLSMPLVNQVTNFLLDRGFLSHDRKKYVLRDAAGLISAIHLFRDMKKTKIIEISTSLEKDEIMKMLPRNAILCLDSALMKYSNWWHSNSICAYVREKDAAVIEEKLFYARGEKTRVRLFSEKLKVAGAIEASGRKFTPKIRTIIDLVCDNQANAAEPLFPELWGKTIAAH